MRRVYFDSNARDEEGRYLLTLPGSVASIQALGDPLRIGETVAIHMDDLEGEGIAEWNHSERFVGFVVRADDTKWRNV